MRVKRDKNKPPASRVFFEFFLKRKKSLVTVVSIIGGLFLLASLGLFWKKGLLEKITRNIPYIVRGVLLNPPERITIDIKFKDYQKLMEKREEALESYFLVSSPEDYVPASITHRGKKIRVDLRLKGDFAYHHLKGEKWSFRVKARDEDNLLGMRRFSLHHPKARSYLSEWVYHALLKREGLVAIRYMFVNVTLNGKNLGLYALEEHFGRHLIENNKYREGIVIRYDDNLFFRNRIRQMDSTLLSGYNNLGYNTSEIRAYEMGRILKNPHLMDQFRTALELAGRLREGELKLSDVFDIPKLAKYYAVCDLMAASHNTLWPNFVIWYNPVTSKFEPIGFDAENAFHGVTKLTPERFMEGEEKKTSEYWMVQHIFPLWEDEDFLRNYFHELERVTQPAYIEKAMEDIREPLADNIGHLWTMGLEGMTSQSARFIRARLHQNAKVIRDKLNIVQGFHAYYSKMMNQKLVLKIANIDTIPFAIEKITYRDQEIARPEGSLILPPRKIYSPIRYDQYKFSLPVDFEWNDEMINEISVHYTIPGTSIRRNSHVFAWDFLDDDFFNEDFVRGKSSFEDVEFFMIDQKSKTVLIKPGTWDVQENIIIPSGWKVIARSGVILNLENGAKILSYSPLEWVGSEDQPIQITSKRATGQGIAIMNAKDPSVFQYVIFENLANPQQGGWALTGAVTFYETMFQMSRCYFLNNRAEDSLNVIRSEFVIEESFFKDAAGDAVDFDFAKGELKRTSFVNSNNDAVDFSGSIVKVSDVFIKSAGDKGISVGEASEVDIKNLKVERCNIAVASKDNSETIVAGITISDTKRAFTVYQKKAEFGPSALTVTDLTLDEVIKPYLVEERSNLIIENKRIASNKEEVAQFLQSL